MEPLVSICIPAYNASAWLREAIDSALSQTWQDFELIVSDNASTDDTLEIVRSYTDPRIRVVTSDRNVGHVENHDKLVRLSRGQYVKFLHADDALAPACVEDLLGPALEDEGVGLVFAPREVLIYDRSGAEWTRMKTKHHERFGRLDRVNEGRALFVQIIGQGIDDNWLGEPSAVLLSRAALQECGLFNRRIRESVDLELYLRVMLRYRIGYVDKVLCLHRQHDESVTAGDASLKRNWLDPLWLLEGLLADSALGPTYDTVFHLRRKALRRAFRSQAIRLMKRQFTNELITYLRFRALPTETRRNLLHGRLGPPDSVGDPSDARSEAARSVT